MSQNLTKASLRRLMGDKVRSLSEEERRRQSELVAKSLWRHSKYQAARRISLYLSTSNEIDTIAILRQALELDQKQCFIPHIKAEAASKPADMDNETRAPRMSMVEINSMGQYEALPVNRYGIREPPGDFSGLEARPGDLELVLVPGVAFAPDGRRLGHGKGYYDEFLANCRRSAGLQGKPAPYSLGLALREQLVSSELVVQDEHDYILDEVLVAEAAD